MRTLLRSFVVSLLVVLMVFVAFAHPGGTDSSGGHKNHSTGEYHYHHGYSAHQHPNGVCPYDYDDATTPRSSSSITTTDLPKSYKTSDSNEDETPYSEEDVNKKVAAALDSQSKEFAKAAEEQEENLKRDADRRMFSCVSVCLLAVFSILIFSSVRANNRVKSEMEKFRAQEDAKKAKWMNERSELLLKFHGRSCREIAGVPPDVVFGMDYIPVKIGGESCVVCKSRDGTKYHSFNCKYRTTYVANLFDLPTYCRPCKVCSPPDINKRTRWLMDYQSCINVKKKYMIDDPDIPYPLDPVLNGELDCAKPKQLEAP